MATVIKKKTTAGATEAKTKDKVKEEKAPRATIKQLACKLILEKKLDNEGIISQVKKSFPESAFGPTHIAFYKNQLRHEGHDIPSTREPKKEKTEAKAKPKAGATKVTSKVKAARTGKLD